MNDRSVLLLAEQKQAMLAAIVITSDDAIISKTLNGIITSWNYSAERIFGYSETEAIGKHISLIIPQDRLDEESFIISRIAAGNKIEHFETIRQMKDGSKIPVSVSVSPIIDANGNVIGASKIARNISEQQRAREKQATLAAIIDTSDDCILSKTLDGNITSWNRAAERMFGYTEKEVLGKHISLIIPPERLSEEHYIISEVSKGNKIDHFQTIRKARDGRLVAISLSVSPIVDENGKVIGASKIARDISEQLAVQAENARLYEEVKMLNDKKDEFIGLASHELKTPLTGIHGYLQILDRMMMEEKPRQFLKKAQLQVKKLNTLVEDLLDVSKIEAGKLQMSVELFDIRALLEDVIEMIAFSNSSFNITLDTTFEKLMVTGDPNRIEQVFINLLTNSVRYSSGEKQVIVKLTSTANDVQVSVKDFGMGIAAEQLEHIFARFYRVDNETSSISGLGIGLYLSHEIVTRHGGRMLAESELGKGSTFNFVLPLTTVS
jgi:PAS domain S-box-containing protein